MRSGCAASSARWRRGRQALRPRGVPIDAPVLDKEGKPTGADALVSRDEGLRANDDGSAARARAVFRPEHSYGRQQLAGVRRRRRVILASRKSRQSLGLKPRARIVATTLVGVDPVTMLKGPIPATTKGVGAGRAEDRRHRHIRSQRSVRFGRAGVADACTSPIPIASIRMAARSRSATRPAPRGTLITTALHELERTNGRYGLISMCCGGGLGTGTIIERL